MRARNYCVQRRLMCDMHGNLNGTMATHRITNSPQGAKIDFCSNTFLTCVCGGSRLVSLSESRTGGKCKYG